MLNHEEAQELIKTGLQLYDNFVSLNTYHFHEHSLDYFFIEKTGFILNDDYQSVKTYHQKVITETRQLLHKLNQTDICPTLNQRMQEVYNNIEKIKIKKPFIGEFKIIESLNQFLKPIIDKYYDYIGYFQTLIQNKNREAVKVVEVLNDYLQTIGVYAISCQEGDEWEEFVFSPQKYVKDNKTSQEEKVGLIHDVLLYAYAIDISGFDEPYILHKGEASIWVLEGE